MADRRRPAVLRSLDGVPVRRGVHDDSDDWEPTDAPAPGAWRSHLFDYKRGLDSRRSNIAATIRACRSSCASSTARTACARRSSRRSCSAARISDGSRSATADDAARADRGGASRWSRPSRGRRRWRCITAASCEQKRVEERRKAILEERNRLARDIHDNLAQGFARHPDAAAGGAARRRAAAAGGRAQHRDRRRSRAHAHDRGAPIGRRASSERRRRRGHRAGAQARSPNSAQKTTDIPIDVARRRAAALRRRRRARDHRHRAGSADQRGPPLARAAHHDPRVDGAARSACGCRWPTTAAAFRGSGRPSGFGMTSMQERADRIGASLTIVTAPRSGTEVVLAWEPSSSADAGPCRQLKSRRRPTSGQRAAGRRSRPAPDGRREHHQPGARPARRRRSRQRRRGARGLRPATIPTSRCSICGCR